MVTVLVVFGGVAAGCENGRVIDATGSGSSAIGPGIGPGQTGSGAVISCGATCSTPAGTVKPVTTPAEVYAALEGRWLFCGGWPPGALPPGAVGVEFGAASAEPISGGLTTAGGAMYYLVAGPSGPVRGVGAAYQLAYDVSQESPTYCQLNMHPMPMSGFGGSVRSSPCPTEVQLSINGTSALLVPVDGAASVAPTPAPVAAGPGPAVPTGCAASCGGPSGKAAMLADTGDISAAVAGSWRICSGWSGPAGVVGIEFGPAAAEPPFDGSAVGGNMYYLVAGPSGPVRGEGFDYQLTYDVSEGFLFFHPGPNSGDSATVALSPCPLELELSIAYTSTPLVLVPFE